MIYTEAQIQADLVDAAFAEANADQELLRRIERGLRYQAFLRRRARGSVETLAQALNGVSNGANTLEYMHQGDR